MGIGYEVAGKVMPSNFFDPNTTLDFTRIMQHQDWYGLLGQTPRPPVPPGKKYPWTRDVDRSAGQCDPGLQDESPAASDDYIFDLDAPRCVMQPANFGDFERTRENFQNRRRSPVSRGKTTLATPVRCSLETPVFHVCLSIEQDENPTGTEWVTATDVKGDNNAGWGAINLGYNL